MMTQSVTLPLEHVCGIVYIGTSYNYGEPIKFTNNKFSKTTILAHPLNFIPGSANNFDYAV